MKLLNYIPVLLIVLTGHLGFGQLTTVGDIDFSTPRDYRIIDIKLNGAPTLDEKAVILLSELQKDQTIRIPGDAIPKAIKKLWEQKMFSKISIQADKVIGNDIWLTINVELHPRIFAIIPGGGIKKKEFEDLKEQLDLYNGKILNQELMYTIQRITKDFFVEKSFLFATANVYTKPDTTGKAPNGNYVNIVIGANRGKKTKIKDIVFEGANSMKHGKLYRAMKETKRRKWWRVWKASKFTQSEFKNDKENILAKYYDKGFRDATIASDTMYKYDDKNIMLKLKIDEGNKYYFGKITWVGNGLYSSGRLDTILNIKYGDPYNQSELESRLFMNPNGGDVTSLYMDNGYLFFSVTPVEVGITDNHIDYEMRITEGKQARVRDIIIKGNTKTNDHIIRREIRTKPGDLFSRNDIIRTQRELAQLNYFDPEKMGVNPIPDPASGTVDIEYTVEEKPSDQIELSGGWGGGRIIGTLGLVINNFSSRNFFKKKAWQPLPSGDGQQLSIRAQSTGAFYQGYNLSFVEPWLGGKKPNSLSVNAFHTFTSNDNLKFSDPLKSKFKIWGASVGLGKRLKWPDDYFQVFHEVSYQYYDLQNFGGLFSFNNGYVNNLAYRFTLSRNSISEPIYPRHGSNITLTAKSTFPYSYVNGKNYADLTDQQRYKFLEYAKLKFTTSHFLSLSNDKEKRLVLNARTGVGFMLPWNKAVGESPFERFYMGGSGLTGTNFIFGREIIALRGYDDNSVSSGFGDPYIVKYTFEMRYAISLNPSATVFILGFTDGGKTWRELRKVNPFEVYRSAGVGVRLFLPMFGMLGFDYGWRLDTLPQRPGMQKGQFHFTIGMNLGEL